MKRLISLVSVFLVASAVAAEEEGFVSIFDGVSLGGWEGKDGAWEVRDGEIRCTGASEGKNWLIYRGEEALGDFVLKMEFRWEKGNSGVQVRSADLGDFQVRGYQVEVAGQDVMGLWHHSLSVKEDPAYKERSHLSLAGQKVKIAKDGRRTVEQVADADEVKAAYREKEWNTLVVRAQGAKLVQEINGVVFSELVDVQKEVSSRSGVIALQDHGKGCVVAFRKIELKR